MVCTFFFYFSVPFFFLIQALLKIVFQLLLTNHPPILFLFLIHYLLLQTIYKVKINMQVYKIQIALKIHICFKFEFVAIILILIEKFFFFFHWQIYSLRVLVVTTILNHLSLFYTISFQSSTLIALKSSATSLPRSASWSFTLRFSFKNCSQ